MQIKETFFFVFSTDFREVLDIYRQHNVTFQKSQIADLMLNPRFSRVPQDMTYYMERANQNHDNTKLLFSGFYIYKSIYELLKATTKFKLAGQLLIFFSSRQEQVCKAKFFHMLCFIGNRQQRQYLLYYCFFK